jgi:RNA polymerase sigma factor (sigma-70 family)
MNSEDSRQRLTNWFRVLREPLRRFIDGRRGAAYLDSDDVAQEVFLRLLRHSNGEDISDPRAYVFKIASNVAYEWSMRARHRLPHDSTWLDELIDDRNVANDCERSERYSSLHSALNDLPPRAREILRLRYGEGLSYEAISTKLSVSQRIVKRDTVRAYAALRFTLAVQNDGTGNSVVDLNDAMGNGA